MGVSLQGGLPSLQLISYRTFFFFSKTKLEYFKFIDIKQKNIYTVLHKSQKKKKWENLLSLFGHVSSPGPTE